MSRLVVYLLVCAIGVACAARQQEARTDAAPCAGTRTVVVYNGTQRTLEVVLSTGTSMGQVIDVIAPGQRSTALRLRDSGTYVLVREQGTRRVMDSRDLRIRYEYGCESL